MDKLCKKGYRYYFRPAEQVCPKQRAFVAAEAFAAASIKRKGKCVLILHGGYQNFLSRPSQYVQSQIAKNDA